MQKKFLLAPLAINIPWGNINPTRNRNSLVITKILLTLNETEVNQKTDYEMVISMKYYSLNIASVCLISFYLAKERSSSISTTTAAINAYVSFNWFLPMISFETFCKVNLESVCKTQKKFILWCTNSTD